MDLSREEKVSASRLMKKVLLVIARFEFGGIPTQAFLWSRFLKKYGYEPLVLAPVINDERYCRMLEEHGIGYAVLQLKSRPQGVMNTFLFLRSLIKSINSHRAYAIFPFNKVLGYNINLVWRLTNVKKCFFMERNDGRDPEANWAGVLVRRAALKNSLGLIYNSEVASMTSHFPGKTIVIKNSFVNPVYQDGISSPSADLSIDEDATVLLHIANLSRQKNYHLLLDSWGELKRRNPRLLLVVVGGKVRESLPEIIEKLNQPGILYAGMQPEIGKYIGRADICLLSTFYEGCPNVVLEYMNNQKLICASDVPALREVLASSNHSLLFRNDSQQDFMDKIEMAINLKEIEKQRILRDNSEKLKNEYAERNFERILELLA